MTGQRCPGDFRQAHQDQPRTDGNRPRAYGGTKRVGDVVCPDRQAQPARHDGPCANGDQAGLLPGDAQGHKDQRHAQKDARTQSQDRTDGMELR